MALRIVDYGSPDYRKLVTFRDGILRKPLGLSFSSEDLEQESGDFHVGAFGDTGVIGCCVLTPVDNDTLKLRQMAVRPDIQGKGIGRDIVGFAETIGKDRGFRRMIMHARKTAVGFYERLGYTVTSAEFEEVTVPHFVMEKPLS